MDLEQKHPVDRAAEVLGTTLEGLGDLLGVSKGAVSQWKDQGRQVPAAHCPKIERMTNGAIRCEELNDTVDWAYLREASGSGTPEQARAS